MCQEATFGPLCPNIVPRNQISLSRQAGQTLSFCDRFGNPLASERIGYLVRSGASLDWMDSSAITFRCFMNRFRGIALSPWTGLGRDGHVQLQWITRARMSELETKVVQLRDLAKKLTDKAAAKQLLALIDDLEREVCLINMEFWWGSSIISKLRRRSLRNSDELARNIGGYNVEMKEAEPR
jgi:hypothetical protein